MSKMKSVVWIGFAALVFLIGFNPISIHSVAAAEPNDKATAVKYDMEASFEENLLLFKGKYVRISLTGGPILSGYVKDVKKGLLHLEKVSERDFFDALVKIDTITAMEAKFRGF